MMAIIHKGLLYDIQLVHNYNLIKLRTHFINSDLIVCPFPTVFARGSAVKTFVTTHVIWQTFWNLTSDCHQAIKSHFKKYLLSIVAFKMDV